MKSAITEDDKLNLINECAFNGLLDWFFDPTDMTPDEIKAYKSNTGHPLYPMTSEDYENNVEKILYLYPDELTERNIINYFADLMKEN